MIKETPGPGQESVWDYPRPPRVEQETRIVRVVFGGETIARSTRAMRVLETSHPPSIYIPQADVRSDVLVAQPATSVCEWKGTASYWDVVVGVHLAPGSAWGYQNPRAGFEALVDHVSFYPARLDACYLDDERVVPQPGGFYGGWITGEVVGPFKGVEGTGGW